MIMVRLLSHTNVLYSVTENFIYKTDSAHVVGALSSANLSKNVMKQVKFIVGVWENVPVIGQQIGNHIFLIFLFTLVTYFNPRMHNKSLRAA